MTQKNRVNITDVGGELVKDTDVYTLRDNTTLTGMIVSSTVLKPKQQTNGHSHPGIEEVYYFTAGMGYMDLDDEKIVVEAGDIVLIQDGVFHKVYNESIYETLDFVCVFNGKRNH